MFTQTVLNEFESCRIPNGVYDSLLESPRCLVSFPKISSFFCSVVLELYVPKWRLFTGSPVRSNKV